MFCFCGAGFPTSLLLSVSVRLGALSCYAFAGFVAKRVGCAMDSGASCHGEVAEGAFLCGNGVVDEAPPIITLNYRPRGSLARTLYQKQQNDYYLTRLDKTQVSVRIFNL